MKAKAGGIDDPLTFPWPAAHIAEGVELDDSARQAVDGFRAEIARSVQAATANGIVDTDGHLTVFGKELERFSGHGSAAFAVSVMLADQLACLPEVVTALALLEDRSILGRPKDRRRFLLPENEKWPTEWRVQARQRHEALYSQCQDDLDAALRIAAAWERSDSEPPWKNTARRREWAAGWWVEHDVLLAAAAHRREILGLLSPRMSEEVKRFLEPRLVPRARAAISRAMQSLEFELQEDGTYRSKSEVAQAVATVDRTSLLQNRPSRVIALQRRLLVSGDISIQSLIELLPWAADDAPEPMELIRRCAERCSPRSLPPASVDRLPPFIASWPVGGRYLAAFSRDAASDVRIAQIEAYIPPFAYTPDVEARAHADEQVEEPQAVGDAAEAEASSLAPDLVAESNISAEEAADVDVQWPGGSPDPEEDEEVVDRFTVLDPEDAESGLESNDEASAAEGSQLARDVLADWEALANESNVGRPAVRPPLDITPDTGDRTWVVCEGYEVGVSGLPQVCLGVDWLDPTTTGDPSLHTDLVIGDEVSVRVGPIVTDGRMNFRTFLRMDGRGRFLVPEFSDRRRNEPPVAVDPHDRQLLRTLNADAHPRATVVPGPAATRTISLLPGLAQHLDAAAKEQLVPSGGRTSSRFPFWRAVVAEPPAADGWARIELQHGDIDLGIRHTFGVTPSVSGGDQIAWDIGTELLVQLEFGPPARLVGGRRELLEDVAERFPRVVFLGDDRDARGPAPKLLMSRRQLTTAVRDALLGERPSASWERRVWDFFLSSHQRRIRSVLSATAGSDRQATQRVAPKVDAYVEFRVGQAVTGTVLEVSDAGLRIGFRNGATGFAGGRGLPSNTAYQIGDLATGIVHEVRPEAGRLILNLAAPGHVVTARLAAHWQDVLPASRARVVSYLSEDLTVSRGTLSVACGSTEHALAVAVRFTELLQLPAAQVDVPSERRGKVVGTKGATIKDLQAMQGVVACSLADDGTLTIIAESSDALRECLRRVVTMCTSRATAVMTVPNTSASGAIIGKGGETIRRLRSASGCTFADTVRGTTEWTLKAGSADAILRFLALANEIAPGCDLPIFEADEPKILDIGAEYIVEDWRHHDFAAVQLGDGQRPQYLPPVDLRLDG